MQRTLRELGLVLLERGWLSSNNIVFRGSDGATVVDTGYDSHAEQTVALLQRELRDEPLARIINTHLHSDHCGGNAALQRQWGSETWVPEVSFDAVRHWDPSRLTYAATDQRCTRFAAQRMLTPGEPLRLGQFTWQVLSAPGHDPEAIMLFQADSRVLISADALWERGLAIIFPELYGRTGFSGAHQALDCIQALAPRVVIPGHGPAFTGVAAAIQASRDRLKAFERDPERHLSYAARALATFRMLDVRRCERDRLVEWLMSAPIFIAMQAQRRGGDLAEPLAQRTIERLLLDGILRQEGPTLSVA
jgi:glyoxylase-like metal-dependent hydrolase (beta-lactamase superfamily II)